MVRQKAQQPTKHSAAHPDPEALPLRLCVRHPGGQAVVKAKASDTVADLWAQLDQQFGVSTGTLVLHSGARLEQQDISLLQATQRLLLPRSQAVGRRGYEQGI